MILKDQITNIFVQIDDFCKEFNEKIKNLKKNALPDEKKRRNRSCLMSDSEIITIMIGFHLGAHKTFKHYYKEIVCGYWKDLFPKSLSYNRFVELQQRSFVVFALFLKEKCLGKCTGISFMDSTTLKVCRKEFIIIRFSKDWQNVENLQWVGFMGLNCIWFAMKKENCYPSI